MRGVEGAAPYIGAGGEKHPSGAASTYPGDDTGRIAHLKAEWKLLTNAEYYDILKTVYKDRPNAKSKINSHSHLARSETGNFMKYSYGFSLDYIEEWQ